MGIQTNSSNEAVVEDNGIKLYSGITSMKVIAINPTLTQLHELGMDYIKKEPEYTNININGTVHNKIVFWLRNEEYKLSVKSEFLVRNEKRQNKDGNKYQWINKEGRFQWGATNPAEIYDWYKNEEVREAYYGEENLTSFVRALFNVRTGDPCQLNVEVFNNDVSSLLNAHAALADNELRCLLGVKDDKYQEVYTHHFGRIKPQRDSQFFTALKDDFKQFKADFDPTLKFGEWTEEVIAASANPPALAGQEVNTTGLF